MLLLVLLVLMGVGWLLLTCVADVVRCYCCCVLSPRDVVDRCVCLFAVVVRCWCCCAGVVWRCVLLFAVDVVVCC